MSSNRLLCVCLAAAALLVDVSAQTPPHAIRPIARFYPDDPLWVDDDMRTIPPPADHELSKSYEFIVNTFSDTAASAGPALNVNTLGEVPDSSWFTNRLGRQDMSLDDVVRGPNEDAGPAPGVWEVTGRPDAGITPKFTIRDARGRTFLIKLDPASNPELASSVEIIGTKILHAIGYHVPQDFLVRLRPDQLAIGTGARARNLRGDRVPIDGADVERWLRHQPRNPDGSIRALASLWIPGRVVGQFTYAGRRSDDPNDLFPHERRRELRAMRVFGAWLNHDDARSINSIDAYVEDGGRRYIRHYMQDFGSTLGSGSTSAQQPRGGHEYLLEPGKVAKGLAGFGLYKRDWMSIRWPTDPAVGNIEADAFDPASWKTEYPNPAFNQLDTADAFWAASIIARFTDPMIRAIVEEAGLSRPEAAVYLTRVIIKRRDKTVRWGVTGTNPIDRFAIDQTVGTELVFDNAARRLGYVGDSTCVVRWAAFDNRTGATLETRHEAQTSTGIVRVPSDIWGAADAAGLRYAVASIETHHPKFPHWAQPVVVTLRERDGRVDVVGIDRPARRLGP